MKVRKVYADRYRGTYGDPPPPKRSGLDRLLGGPGEEPRCIVIDEDPVLGVHWFRRGAKPGDACLCGKTTMREEGE